MRQTINGVATQCETGQETRLFKKERSSQTVYPELPKEFWINVVDQNVVIDRIKGRIDIKQCQKRNLSQFYGAIGESRRTMGNSVE